MEATRAPPQTTAAAADNERGTVLRPELANVVALATDPVLLDQLREAVDNRHRLWRAENVTHAAELAVAASHGVLLIDAAVTTPDTADIVVRLRSQFPALCILVAGRRDDEAQLGALISSGDVYRFLHKPLSVDRVRNFIDAAVRRQQSLPETAATEARAVPARAEVQPRRPPAPTASGGAGSDRSNRSRTMIVVAVTALVLGGWALWSRDDGAPRPPATSAAPDAVRARQDIIGTQLAAAREALETGRLVDPPGSNAVQLYRSVLNAQPGNASAIDGLHRAAETLLDRAEQSFAGGDLLAAANLMDGARLAEPGSPRLADLRARMDRARAALNAAPAPGTITKLDPGVVPQSRQQEARALIGRARARIAAGDLVDGPQSAAALLAAARQANPKDSQLDLETERLGDAIVARARSALDQRRFAEAVRWIGAVDALDGRPGDVQRLRAELDAARRLAGREENLRLLTLANQRIAQDRLIDPEGDSARHYLDMLRAADGDFPGLAEAGQTLAARALASMPGLLQARRWSDAERMLQAAAAQRADAAALREANDALQRARTASAAPVMPPLVAESELERTQAVAAHYPARASSRGLEGTVDAEFTIGTDGTTRNVTILSATSPGTFDQAVVEAIRQWRYRPVVINGRVGEVRTRARLRFKLSDR